MLTIGRGGVGGSYLSTAAGFEPAVALLLVDAWSLTRGGLWTLRDRFLNLGYFDSWRLYLSGLLERHVERLLFGQDRLDQSFKLRLVLKLYVRFQVHRVSIAFGAKRTALGWLD